MKAAEFVVEHPIRKIVVAPEDRNIEVGKTPEIVVPREDRTITKDDNDRH